MYVVKNYRKDWITTIGSEIPRFLNSPFLSSSSETEYILDIYFSKNDKNTMFPVKQL